MTNAIDKLKEPPPMVPGCTTCRHYDKHPAYSYRPICDAVGGGPAETAFMAVCKGNMWEHAPQPVPILVRFKRWLIG